MKLMQRNGCVFSCGWLPPAGCTELGARFPSGVSSMYMSATVDCASTLPAGEDSVPTLVVSAPGIREQA